MIYSIVLCLVLTYAAISVNADSFPDSNYARRVRGWLITLAAASFSFFLWLSFPSSWTLWLRIPLCVLGFLCEMFVIIPLAFILLVTLRLSLNSPPLLRHLASQLYLRHWGGLAGGTRLVFKPTRGSKEVGTYTPIRVEAMLMSQIQQKLPDLCILNWDEYASVFSTEPKGRTMFAEYLLENCMGVADIARLDLCVIAAQSYDPSSGKYVRGSMGFLYGGNHGIENNGFDYVIKDVAEMFCHEYLRLNPKNKG